ERGHNANKGTSASLKRRVLITVTLTLLVLFFLSIPALAAVYRYTGTHFRYIGDIFHEKVVDFDNGRAGFQVSGEGSVSGSHQVTTVRYDDAPVDGVYREAAELALYLYGTTSPNAAADKKLRMISGLQVNISAKTDVVTGVEMDPGESGYIKQTVSTSSSPDGEYMQVNNNFGNTGGTTVREMEVKGFISDNMRVEGYAEVWETTTVRDGKASAGWWMTLP
ncbi:MAG: hypothetical protein ACNA7Z_09555, partial [Dethiobacteria bacterium]